MQFIVSDYYYTAHILGEAAYSEGGKVETSNEWGGRKREGEARAKPGNQLVYICILAVRSLAFASRSRES